MTKSRLAAAAVAAVAALAATLFGLSASAAPQGPAVVKAQAGKAVKGANTAARAMTPDARAAAAARRPARSGAFAAFDHHGVDPALYASRKAQASASATSPRNIPSAQINAAHPAVATATAQTGGAVNTPGAGSAFPGMRDSAAICPFFGGCQPPDMAVASDNTFVVQAVNTSIAVYSTAGALQLGFPTTLSAFFGAPDPTPAGCDARGDFFSDPRAFYDPIDQRFWVLGMQVEGRAGLNAACDRLSLYWIAVTATSDPTGIWNIYAFDMALSGPNWADYPGFGFDSQAVYFSGNMFPFAGGGFQTAEVFAASKASMEAGLGVGYAGFIGQSVGGVLTDTIQPVETISGGVGPQTEFLVQTFNIRFGGGQCVQGCSGVVLWAFSNPLSQQASGQSLTGVVLATNGYSLAPPAPNPGSGQGPQAVDTLDTRITGTPTYSNGQIWFSIDTGVNNGTQNTPGILFGELQGVINDGAGACTLCTTISASSRVLQQGYYVYGGDGAAWYGTLAPDSEGNVHMVFNFSGLGFNPSSAYVSRRVTFQPGAMHDNGNFLVASTIKTLDSRWGDYSAAGFTGFATDTVWIAAEHSCTDNGDWCTALGSLRYSLTGN